MRGQATSVACETTVGWTGQKPLLPRQRRRGKTDRRDGPGGEVDNNRIPDQLAEQRRRAADGEEGASGFQCEKEKSINILAILIL